MRVVQAPLCDKSIILFPKDLEDYDEQEAMGIVFIDVWMSNSQPTYKNH